MTTAGRPTKGMEILGIRLFACEFSFMPEDDVAPRLAKLPPGDRSLRTTTKTDVVDSGVDPKNPQMGRVAIVVSVDGAVQDVTCWSIRVGYQGLFRLSPDGDVTMDAVLKLHAPAQLYSFAREYVADIARRAELGAQGLYIPPWNFQAALPPTP